MASRVVPSVHSFPIKVVQGIEHCDFNGRYNASADISCRYIYGRNISPTTCSHVHNTIFVHREPTELPTLRTGGTRAFAVRVMTIGCIDTLGFDTGELLQYFDL